MNYRRLPTDSRRLRPPSILAAALAFSLVAAACGSSAPTAIIIYATPTPAPVTPTPEPMPTPTATPTPAFTPTPGPSDAATPTPPTAATPTPAVTSTPGSTGPAGACSGGINVQHFFADTAAAASFDVYCGVVSKPWFFDASTYTAEGLDIIYCTQTNSGHTCPSGPKIELKEGPFPTYGSIGPGSFGNLSGQLYSVSGGGFLIYVSPGTEKSYLAIGSGGITQTTFVNTVKALVKVPKA